jgi:hypothetical protein
MLHPYRLAAFAFNLNGMDVVQAWIFYQAKLGHSNRRETCTMVWTFNQRLNSSRNHSANNYPILAGAPARLLVLFRDTWKNVPSGTKLSI